MEVVHMLKEILNHEITVKRGVLISLIAALVLSMSVTGYLLMGDYGENVIIKKSNDDVEISFGKEVEEEEIETEKIKVYVVGEVKNPSVVTIEKGQIIEDAVLLAGGFTENADVENINLAYVLTENVMLQIRPKKDISEKDISEKDISEKD
ncbi:MAG: competence protein ComEA, partial [Clostridium sp.]|nr:competence protein ComEA [Clostridium sp.]